MDRQPGLELAHPLAERHKLGVLRGRDDRLDPGVDSCLAVPRINRLAADPQLHRDRRGRDDRLDQIDHAPPEIPSVP